MQKDEDNFLKALNGEDELGVVVRAHIHIEAHLHELVERMGADPKHIKKMQLDYAQLVHLVIALGLKDEHASPLLALGKLRNDFAHKPDTALTDHRVTDFYNTLCASDKEIVQRVYLSTKSKLELDDSPKSIRGLSPRDQFILIAVALRGMILAAITQMTAKAM